jgi:hypothetical protein
VHPSGINLVIYWEQHTLISRALEIKIYISNAGSDKNFYPQKQDIFVVMVLLGCSLLFLPVAHFPPTTSIGHSSYQSN